MRSREQHSFVQHFRIDGLILEIVVESRREATVFVAHISLYLLVTDSSIAMQIIEWQSKAVLSTSNSSVPLSRMDQRFASTTTREPMLVAGCRERISIQIISKFRRLIGGG